MSNKTIAESLGITDSGKDCHDCSELGVDLYTTSTKPSSTRRMVVLGVCGGIFATTCALTAPFITPALRKVCLPYIPATTQQARHVMNALKGRQGKVLDLGSGDGRLVIEAAQLGFQAHGVELNPWLVFYSRFNARRQGVNSLTKFYRKDMWKVDLSQYENIIIFGVETMMDKLEDKLDKELSHDSQVIACRFPLPTWQATQEFDLGGGGGCVWVYKRPQKDNTIDKKDNTEVGVS